MLHVVEDIGIDSNVELILRNLRGEVVDRRVGHNILTSNGKNWLSKLIAWSAIVGPDEPFTHRRLRWMAVGTGLQLEVATVSSLAQPALFSGTAFMAALSSPATFPTLSSVRVSRTFGVNEISITGAPVALTEVGLFADVVPGNMGGTEDTGHSAATDPTLNPAVGTNPPVAYKSFETLTKTTDVQFEVRWDFRF